MTPREELLELRRLDELEAKAAGGPVPPAAPNMSSATAVEGPAPKMGLWDAIKTDAKTIGGGIADFAKSVATTPGDIVSGKFNPVSDEGIRRAMAQAMLITPLRGRPAPRFKAPAEAPVPSAKELKAASDAGYKAAGESGVEYTSASVKGMADELVAGLNSEGYFAKLAPKTHAVLDELRAPPPGSTAPLKNIDAMRKVLGKVAGSPDATEASAASEAIARIDRFLEEANPSSVSPRTIPTSGMDVVPRGFDFRAADASYGTGMAKTTAEVLAEARGNAAAGFRSGRIKKVEQKVERQTAAANSGFNYDNKLRQKLEAFLDNAKKSRGLNSQEIEAIEKIVMGSRTKNTARNVSNMLGGGGGMGRQVTAAIGAGAGSAIDGGVGAAIGAVVVPSVGAGLKAAQNAMARREIARLDALIRSRSPLAERMKQEAASIKEIMEKRAALVRSLTAGTLAGQQEQTR